ncbi:MAG: preprotein translocase subunit SecE [Vulcanimicrobiota bacterium]
MAGQPAPKRTGPRRSRGESKAALAHAGSKTTVQAATVDAPAPSGWTPAALKAYLQGVRLEMGRVSWPTARELQAATTVVMVTLILFAGYLGVLDFFLKRTFR